jgi:hypothetical protein
MTYTDAQGRPELVMDPDIARGTATYRHLSDDGQGPERGEPQPRRRLSPIRAAAAAILRGDPPADG